MSHRKEILAAIESGEYADTGWSRARHSTVVHQIKRLEAQERNERTPVERRRATRRVWTTRPRRARHFTAKGGRS